MTFAEMQADVRRKLNESTEVFFTNEDIQEALNDGLEEISDASEWYERQANIVCHQERTYYDLREVLPDTFLSLLRCWNTETQQWLIPTDPRELDYHTTRQWEVVTGSPQKYFIRGNWWLGVFPASASDLGSIRTIYTALPPEMDDDDDEPGFPREFHYGIVSYALSDLEGQQKDTDKALRHWQTYLTYQEKLSRFVQERQSIDRTRHL